MFRHFIILGLLSLTACQNSASSDENVSTAPTLSVRATTDIKTLAPVTDVTYLPNTGVAWLSQIILLDGQGRLERVRIDDLSTVTAHEGSFKDITAITRQGAPGVFFALDMSGRIKAFIENDDEGNFRQIPTSAPSTTYSGFCDPAQPISDTIIGLTNDGRSHPISVQITDNMSVTLTKADSPLTCTDHSRDLLRLTQTAPSQLYAWRESGPTRISIEDGLSIAGLSNPDMVSTTQVKFGSAFNDGIVVAASKDENRVVIIARDYLLEELERAQLSTSTE